MPRGRRKRRCLDNIKVNLKRNEGMDGIQISQEKKVVPFWPAERLLTALEEPCSEAVIIGKQCSGICSAFKCISCSLPHDDCGYVSFLGGSWIVGYIT
jgi:hypothetical protein